MEAPIVFLHGFLGTPAAWDEVIAALPGVAAIAPALPGHSHTPATGNSFDDAVAAFTRALPDGPCTLAGYSLGARIALALALRHPDRFPRAILCGVHPGLDDDALSAARAAEDDRLAARILSHGLPAFVDDWERLPLFATQSDAMRARQRPHRLSHDPSGIAWALRTFSLGRMPNRFPQLARSSPSLLLLTGERDEKFSALAKRITAIDAHAIHRAIPGAGHNAALESPREFAHAMREFLATAPGSTATR
jgi:2-succinyl-6-hydroxy-2,4-cyclohexadiene-1-carboxylate synthase